MTFMCCPSVFLGGRLATGDNGGCTRVFDCDGDEWDCDKEGLLM